MGHFVILHVKINLKELGLFAGKNAQQLISLNAQPSVLLIYKNAINRQKLWLKKLFHSVSKLLKLTQQVNMTQPKLSNQWAQLL
jgi:hypothetical protein